MLGATGLIGAAVSARLQAEGHHVVRLARSVRGNGIVADLAMLTHEEDWHPHLKGIDAVVNCAGVLQDGPRDQTAKVHAEAVGALVRACEALGVKRIVHISAIGVDRTAPTEFSRTKLEGDKALMARGVDWVILRPSVVTGRGAFGGSALLRGLAALPVLPAPPDVQPFQVVQLDDLVETVLFFLRPDAPAKLMLEPTTPDRLSFVEVIAAYRRWLGWKPATVVRMPAVLARLVYGVGDLLSWLGWRPPLRSTARLELERGVAGDPAAWIARASSRVRFMMRSPQSLPPSKSGGLPGFTSSSPSFLGCWFCTGSLPA